MIDIEVDPQSGGFAFQSGQALEKLYRIEEAREMYERGIEVAARLEDADVLSELEAALNLLPL